MTVAAPVAAPVAALVQLPPPRRSAVGMPPERFAAVLARVQSGVFARLGPDAEDAAQSFALYMLDHGHLRRFDPSRVRADGDPEEAFVVRFASVYAHDYARRGTRRAALAAHARRPVAARHAVRAGVCVAIDGAHAGSRGELRADAISRSADNPLRRLESREYFRVILRAVASVLTPEDRRVLVALTRSHGDTARVAETLRLTLGEARAAVERMRTAAAEAGVNSVPF